MGTLNEHDADKGRCFVTSRFIATNESARFTSEFDAWISPQGQRMIEAWVGEGMKTPNKEWEIIYREWYAADESAAARWDDANRDFLTED